MFTSSLCTFSTSKNSRTYNAIIERLEQAQNDLAAHYNQPKDRTRVREFQEVLIMAIRDATSAMNGEKIAILSPNEMMREAAAKIKEIKTHHDALHDQAKVSVAELQEGEDEMAYDNSLLHELKSLNPLYGDLYERKVDECVRSNDQVNTLKEVLEWRDSQVKEMTHQLSLAQDKLEIAQSKCDVLETAASALEKNKVEMLAQDQDFTKWLERACLDINEMRSSSTKM